MVQTYLKAIAVLAITVTVGVAGLLAQFDGAVAQTHSASRYFPANWAAPGSELHVSITPRNTGGFAQVVEMLPEGFTYLRSSLDEFQVQADGRSIHFNLLGEGRFTYVATVPAQEGQYTFSGVIRNADRAERTITGYTSLRVGPPPTPTPSPTPAPSPTSTPSPTPAPPPTSTPSPTPAPSPTPTPSPTPAPSPTPTPSPTPAPSPTPTPSPTQAGTLAPTPLADPTIEPTPAITLLPSPTPAATEGVEPDTTAPSEAAGPGIQTWLIILIVAGVAVAIVGVVAYAYWRRR